MVTRPGFLGSVFGSWVILSVALAQASEQVYYFHNDYLGTPQAMSDAAGRTVWTAEYEPFGKATVNHDPDGDGQIVLNNLRFPGQYFDAETGIHYNYHRDYDPETGRYLQADPIGLDGGPNLYAYAGNNPVRAIDPRGLLSVAGAFYHYLEGDGSPVQVNFNDIDTSFVRPSQFRGFQQILRSIERQTVTVKVDDKQPFSMKGSDWLIYGTLTLRLLGMVQSDECKWSFDGCLRAYDDLYDFNAANRSRVGEGLTWLGRQMGGTPYWIEIRGQKPIRESGNW